jgi:uncharacterized protein GlcG (DUF336 family)
MILVKRVSMVIVLLIGTAGEFAQAEELPRESVLPLALASKATAAAVDKCKQDGYRVSAAVVDRAGVLRVLMRGDGAGPHTTDSSSKKAYTAASLRRPTSELAELITKVSSLQALRDMNDRILILARPARTWTMLARRPASTALAPHGKSLRASNRHEGDPAGGALAALFSKVFRSLGQLVVGQHTVLQSEDLAQRPGLKGAAPRGVWRVGIGNLGDMAQARLFQVSKQRVQVPGSCLLLGGGGAPPDPHPGF